QKPRAVVIERAGDRRISPWCGQRQNDCDRGKRGEGAHAWPRRSDRQSTAQCSELLTLRAPSVVTACCASLAREGSEPDRAATELQHTPRDENAPIGVDLEAEPARASYG